MQAPSTCARAAHVVLLVTAVLLASATAWTSPASAGVEFYCVTGYDPYETCKGPRHSLTANRVDSVAGIRKCAGAFRGDDRNAFYGSYFCAQFTYACHDYSGDLLLFPAAHKGGASGSDNLTPRMSFGVDRLSGCPSGG